MAKKEIPEITPQDLGHMLRVLARMDNPPALMVYGAPGIGKTAILKEFAQQKYDLRVKHLSRMDATDWSGIPKQGSEQKYTEFMPISLFKKVPEGKEKIVLFFDELNTAMPQVLNAALDVILEKKGEGEGAVLPANTIILAAGNLGPEEDGTYVETLSAAVKTRMIQVRLQQDVDQWIEWANAHDIHESVIKFIRQHPAYLVDLPGFRDNRDQIATPRGWERVSDLIKMELNNPPLLEKMVIGTIGRKAGELFLDMLYRPDVSEEKWRQNVTAAEIFYSRNDSDYTPQNFARLTQLVNEGLACKYKGSREKAQQYANHLRQFPLEKSALSVLAEVPLKELESFLETHHYPDVLQLLRESKQ